jgi:RNA polymerase sigma factor (sigma-70 family)
MARTADVTGAVLSGCGYAWPSFPGWLGWDVDPPAVNKEYTPPAAATLEGDLRLLAAFKRGEHDALARVLDLYAPIVATAVRAGIRFTAGDGEVMRIGQDLMEHDVELIVQETFVRAFAESARASYDGVRSFKLWVLTIARNLVIDLAREKWRGVAVPFESVDRFASDDPAPDETVEENELRRLVDAFAAALEEPDRSVYRLRYEEQKNVRETGVALAMTEIRVRRREAQLRDRLLRYLREHGFLTKARVSFASSLLSKKGAPA